MKFYTALLINGAEEGRRAPIHLHVVAEASSQNQLALTFDRTITLGPVENLGYASIGFFTSEVFGMDDLFLEIGIGPAEPGQSISYVAYRPERALSVL